MTGITGARGVGGSGDGDGSRGSVYELPGCDFPVNLRTLLLAASHQLSAVSTFASVVSMILQEELNVWYGEGQWKVGNNVSVKKALQHVRVEISILMFLACSIVNCIGSF